MAGNEYKVRVCAAILALVMVAACLPALWSPSTHPSPIHRSYAGAATSAPILFLSYPEENPVTPDLPAKDEGKKNGITLKIITRHDTTIQLYLEQAFLDSPQAQQNGVTDIQWTQPGAEYWPTVIPTFQPDIAWGGGPTLFDILYNQGFLKKLNSTYMQSVLSRVNDTIAGAAMKRFDEDGDPVWVAAAISSFGFTINKQWLQSRGLPEPTHWENLTSPEFGKLLPATPTISMGNSPGTTSNTRIYEIILQRFGWEKGWETLTRMAGNARIYSGSVETQNAVENGIVGVSMSIDFYGYTSALRNPDCKYVIPTNGSIINGDPIAICSTCKHQNASEAFLDFILSAEGQKYWLLEEINRLPVLEEAFHTDIGQTRSDLYSFYNATMENLSIEFNDSLALSYEYSLMYYFQAVLTDAHDTLRECWAALVDAYFDGRITEDEFEDLAAQMAKPVSWDGNTFTQDYAISINDQMGSSSAFRESMMDKWTAAAIAQYTYVMGLIPGATTSQPPTSLGFLLIVGGGVAAGVAVVAVVLYFLQKKKKKT